MCSSNPGQASAKTLSYGLGVRSFLGQTLALSAVAGGASKSFTGMFAEKHISVGMCPKYRIISSLIRDFDEVSINVWIGEGQFAIFAQFVTAFFGIFLIN